jgi:hypothetical protein
MPEICIGYITSKIMDRGKAIVEEIKKLFCEAYFDVLIIFMTFYCAYLHMKA